MQENKEMVNRLLSSQISFSMGMIRSQEFASQVSPSCFEKQGNDN